MTTIAVERPSVVIPRATLFQLARIEAARYARHPLFLAGFVLACAFSAGEIGPIELDYHVIPSFFLGVLGLVVAARLTTATDRAAPVVGAAPVSELTRTAAMCLACLVPTAAGLLVVLMHRSFVLADPFPEFLYGTYGSADRFAITIVVPVIACAGGPLLGVAAGRWLRFPGASLVSVLLLLFWSTLAAAVPSSMDPSTVFARTLHMLAPYTAFALADGDGERPVTVITSLTGSPTWFAVWTALLCALAATTALWRATEGRARSVLGRWIVGLAALSLAALTLSVAFGNDQPYETRRAGTVVAGLSTYVDG